MKCNKCGYEDEKELNFCPNCGAKINENVLINNQEQPQTIKLTNPKEDIIGAIMQLLFFFGLGLSVVTLFIGFKGFGLLKNRVINFPMVWGSFAVAIIITVTFGLLYYFKYIKEK